MTDIYLETIADIPSIICHAIPATSPTPLIATPTMSTTTLQSEQLKGNCHCGRFRFVLPADLDVKDLITCACTLCTKLGCIWLRDVTTDSFTVRRNEGGLVEYQGLKFCGNCGTAVTAEHQSGVLKGEVLVNARSGWGFDPFGVDLGYVPVHMIVEKSC